MPRTGRSFPEYLGLGLGPIGSLRRICVIYVLHYCKNAFAYFRPTLAWPLLGSRRPGRIR
jgi:hypothetical protein